MKIDIIALENSWELQIYMLYDLAVAPLHICITDSMDNCYGYYEKCLCEHESEGILEK